MQYSTATGLAIAVDGVKITHPAAFGGVSGRIMMGGRRSGKTLALKLASGKTARKRVNMPDRKQQRDARRAERNQYTGAYKIH